MHYLSDVQLNMYGSSISGFGLKGLSDLNIELTAERAPPVLKELYTILKADKSGKVLFFSTCLLMKAFQMNLFLNLGILL